jgi:divalent metal cation (Fe/Co/Zn/Cd) transporter
VDDAIREVASHVPGVIAVEKCRARKYGLELIVDIHVEVDGRISVRDGHDIAHRVKDALVASPLKVSDALVHVEPVVSP